MRRVVEDLGERAVLADASLFKYEDAVRDTCDDAEVVGDEEHCKSRVTAQSGE